MEFFGPCKNQREQHHSTRSQGCVEWWWRRFMSVASWGLSRVLVIFRTFSMVQSEDVYPLWGLLGVVIQESTLYLTGQLQLNPMAFKWILEDTLSLFSIPQFLGMSGWKLWLGRVFQTFRSSTCCGRFVAVLYHVVSGHPAFSLLCNRQFLLKVVDWNVFQTYRSSLRYLHICMLYMLQWLFPAYNLSWHWGSGSNSLLR